MEKLEIFKQQFEKVFDEEGNVKACGREACKELINMCKVQDSQTDFGDPMTGMMNVRNILLFRKKIFLEK